MADVPLRGLNGLDRTALVEHEHNAWLKLVEQQRALKAAMHDLECQMSATLRASAEFQPDQIVTLGDQSYVIESIDVTIGRDRAYIYGYFVRKVLASGRKGVHRWRLYYDAAGALNQSQWRVS